MRLTDETFDDALSGVGAILVAFWADWCGPCRVMKPVLDEYEANGGALRLNIIDVNIDESPMTPLKYGVRGIPTLMMFKDGKVSATAMGAMSREKFAAWIEEKL